VTNGKKVLEISKGNLNDSAVWFMRQAGRYLPEYESLKKGKTFLDMLKDPLTISRISSLPLDYFDVDAVVIFTDILVPFTRLGYKVSYENGISVTKGRDDNFDYYSPLSKGLKRISEEHREKTIVGVVGGPFTTLSYLYDQGKPGYHRSKEVLASGDENILEDLTEEILDFAKLQVDSGADVIQIFDSWLGGVSENYYTSHLEKNEKYFVEKVKELGRPVIFFSEGASHLYHRFIELRPDVFSIDWRTGLDRFNVMCNDCIVQGNLDPYLLGTDDGYLKRETSRIMDQGRKFKGHIFNLGHGVPPWADWRKLELVTREVHAYER
jgi:uroporphyrinogen decarboxylase